MLTQRAAEGATSEAHCTEQLADLGTIRVNLLFGSQGDKSDKTTTHTLSTIDSVSEVALKGESKSHQARYVVDIVTIYYCFCY